MSPFAWMALGGIGLWCYALTDRLAVAKRTIECIRLTYQPRDVPPDVIAEMEAACRQAHTHPWN